MLFAEKRIDVEKSILTFTSCFDKTVKRFLLLAAAKDEPRAADLSIIVLSQTSRARKLEFLGCQDYHCSIALRNKIFNSILYVPRKGTKNRRS